MIVNCACLPDLPADRDQLVQLGAVNQVARVMLPVPEKARFEGRGIDRIVGQEAQHPLGVGERRFWQPT